MNNFIKYRIVVNAIVVLIFAGLFGTYALSICHVVSDKYSDNIVLCDFMDGEMESDENEEEQTEEDDEKDKLKNFNLASLLKDFTKNVKNQMMINSIHFFETPTPPPDFIT